MRICILLVGPPGSGKTTLAEKLVNTSKNIGLNCYHINQDKLGKEKHLKIFQEALNSGADIVIDRMNFTREQRERYLLPAKQAGYMTIIRVLHEPSEVCLERCLSRKGHETIKDKKSALNALNTFFSKYERVQDSEADEVQRHGWNNNKGNPCIALIDLDGTLANIDHRLKYVSDSYKKDWKSFFNKMTEDSVNVWCSSIVNGLFNTGYQIFMVSGRPDDYMNQTKEWLGHNHIDYHKLFMRRRGDYRSDEIVKEIILDFEILPRGIPLVAIDDRASIVKLWRSRGITCLDCSGKDF